MLIEVVTERRILAATHPNNNRCQRCLTSLLSVLLIDTVQTVLIYIIHLQLSIFSRYANICYNRSMQTCCENAICSIITPLCI
jgi:hypothetical protein